MSADLSAVFSDVEREEPPVSALADERVLLDPFVPDALRDAWSGDADDDYEVRS